MSKSLNDWSIVLPFFQEAFGSFMCNLTMRRRRLLFASRRVELFILNNDLQHGVSCLSRILARSLV